MNAKEHYEAGRLDDAIAEAVQQVKRSPADSGKRGFLAELLCFAGQWERADRQLETIGHQNPESMIGIAVFRQLIRAEQARQDFYAEGRVPDFLDQPGERLGRHLEASILIREGDDEKAAELLRQAEDQRPQASGTSAGQPFEDLRDLDDLVASFFEVLTTTGKYYWIPMERVELIEFHPPKRPRDLLWRSCHMVVMGGPDGEVFLPALYAGSHADSDDRLRLGRSTDWRGGDGRPVRGVGQRMFLVGSEDQSILAMERLEFSKPRSAAPV